MAPLIEEDLPSSRRASIDRNQSDRSPVENVLFNEERPLRGPSAPAVMFMTRLAAADQDLDSIFTSQDLVMLPRYAKTAPPIYAQSNSANISKYFPSMSWSARLQNSRLVDLLKFVQTTDSRGGRMTMSEETEISEAQIIQGLFESDIAEIYKLIGMGIIFQCGSSN